MSSQIIRYAAFAVGVLAAGSAMAQELPPFGQLSACRLDELRATVTLVYDGGACEEVGQGAAIPTDPGTLAAVFPIVKTADMCTMNIVPVTAKKAIDVLADTNTVAVTLLSPTGEPKVFGAVTLGAPTTGCEAGD